MNRARVIVLDELYLNSTKHSSMIMYSLRMILSVLREGSIQISLRLVEDPLI